MVPESPVEQIVEFSIDLVDPGYRELLDDPDSPQYIDLAHHLQDQVRLLLPALNCFYPAVWTFPVLEFTSFYQGCSVQTLILMLLCVIISFFKLYFGEMRQSW